MANSFSKSHSIKNDERGSLVCGTHQKNIPSLLYYLMRNLGLIFTLLFTLIRYVYNIVRA